MNYWIFKANPEKYGIDKRLLDSDPSIIWAITRYQDRIQNGDTVFIWRTGTPRGICAVMEVEMNPYEPGDQEVDDSFVRPSDNSAAPHSVLWAKCHISQRFPIIEENVIKKIPGLELFSFFSAFPKATNFSITRPEGSILLEFIEKYQAEEPTKKRETVRKSAAKVTKPASIRTASAVKSKAVKPASTPPEFELLKCETCGRYVVRSDTERHASEVHAGQSVEWKKMAK
jgi:predicted RNA-binding protein with PUA-like domain